MWTNWIRIPPCEGISPFVVASGPAQEHYKCVLFTRGIKRSDREAEQSPAFLIVEKCGIGFPSDITRSRQLPVRPSRRISRKQEIKEKCRCRETGAFLREMPGRKLDTAL